LSRRRCGSGLLKLDAVGTEGVEWSECDACKVCLLGFLLKSGEISIALTGDESSRSSLLSDCTKGLVGGFKMKLDEYEDDKDGARDRGPSKRFTEGNLGSAWKGEKFRGGVVESHSCLSELSNPTFASRSLWSVVV
jgi:hypothetical protein